MRRARLITLAGHVQGVGFRPFVYRLATQHGLCGWVQNHVGEVRILLQGTAGAISAFRADLAHRSPPLARFRVAADEATPTRPLRGFEILGSDAESAARVFVPPDSYTCPDCLDELADPQDRRYRYPFINCTNCGPRYTLIRALPYDRRNTSMASFALCAECAAEYTDPRDRRFHAEPVACPECGPAVVYREDDGVEARGEAALTRLIAALSAGQSIAVKGIGGYHLICDARSDAAVARLRSRKRRPDKPLAVMFPLAGADGLEAVRAEAELSAAAARTLASGVRPIVLARQRPGGTLSRFIAPGLAEIGIFLPYSPLHQLITTDFGRPIVATSGNRSGEPMLTDECEAQRRLAGMVDGFLHHDREIVRPADDPVCREIAGRLRPLRLGRGCAPVELPLPARLDGALLALGGHLKNTVALAWEDRVVVSSHLGEMDAPRSLEVFERAAQDLQSLYAVTADVLVCDAHPRYATTRWAERSGLETHRVFHHFAHASALAGEHLLEEPMLVFTWDGVGLGEDGTLWGGEALLGRPGAWRRVGSIRRFRLPGGDRAAREPWRCAASVCWESGRRWDGVPAGTELVHQAWRRGVNAPPTSAVGRLFDAAAAIVLGVETVSYEGQAPMMLEAAAGEATTHLELPLRTGKDGIVRLDWAVLLGPLLDQARPVPERAALFHESLAHGIVTQARLVRGRYGIGQVGLTGGVFQNARLTESALARLERAGFTVRLSERIPCNDAGLSFGQAVETAARLAR